MADPRWLDPKVDLVDLNDPAARAAAS